MRASRLLQILLLLQNRGRQTSVQLARELEVTPRTILRDVDAMTEAGLPIIVHQGNRGGIELGFNYRTRLTGLAADEAEALGVILGTHNPVIDAVGLTDAARRASAKLVESFPDAVRTRVVQGRDRFVTATPKGLAPDPRIDALARAIRGRNIVSLRARSSAPASVYPIRLCLTPKGWTLICAKTPNRPIPIREWGDLNISGRQFPNLDATGRTTHTA